MTGHVAIASRLAAVVTCLVAALFAPAHALASEMCTVDGEVIAESELEQLIQQARIQYVDNGRAFPRDGSDEFVSLQWDLVNLLVTSRIRAQQATALDVRVPDAAVDRAYTELLEATFDGDEVALLAELQRSGMTVEQLRADLHADLRDERLYRRVVSQVVVTDVDVRRYFATHRSRFLIKPRRRVAHILVRSREQARRIHRQTARRGMTAFARAARRHSLDPSTRRTGGVLVLWRGQAVQPFDRVAFALRTGVQASPVRTTYGWHVIRALGDTVPGRRQPLAEVAAGIRKELLDDRRSAVHTRWINQAYRAATVTCVEPYRWSVEHAIGPIIVTEVARGA